MGGLTSPAYVRRNVSSLPNTAFYPYERGTAQILKEVASGNF